MSEFFCAIAFGLMVLTLCGIGVLALFRSLIRGLSSDGANEPTLERAHTCPICLGSWPARAARCPHCCWSGESDAANFRPTALAALNNHLARLRQLGALRKDAYAKLAQIIRGEQAELSAAAAALV